MKLRRLIAAASVVVASAGPGATAQKADADRSTELQQLRAEVIELETALVKVRYVHDRCSDPSVRAASEQSIRERAKQAEVTALELKGVEGIVPVTPADGRPSPVGLRSLDIRARGSFFDVHRFLRRVAFMREGSLDFDTISVKAETPEIVSFAARISEACWVDLPHTRATPPSGHTAAEVEIAMYRARLQELRSASAAVSQLVTRFQPMRLMNLLAALDEDWGDRAVRLSDLRFVAPTLTLHGVAVGAPARTAVDASLRKAGLEMTRIEWSPAGDCSAFTAITRLTDSSPGTHDLAPKEIFDERIADLCNSSSRPAARAVTAQGSGNLTLHLRDVDVADVFRVLNDVLPSDGFVVEPAVTGRVNVDIDAATLDETLAALRSAGVAFVGPGPVHLVCKTDCGEPTARHQNYAGEPITMTVKDAEVTDVLRSFEFTSLRFHPPRDLRARISVFVRGTPWDRVFDGVVSSVRLKYSPGESADIYLRSEPDVVRAQKSSVAPRPGWLSEPPGDKLGVDDIRLAALGRSDGPWKAYAHVPGSPGRIFALDVGTTIFDGRVESVGRESVTFRTTAGREVVVALRPTAH